MSRKVKVLLIIFSLLFLPRLVFAVANTMTITEADGATKTNYPVQMGRPFVEGEIEDYPQVLIDGTPVTTQANVKCRWSDGSVKHAVLMFLIPSITAGDTIAVTFQNQASGNNTALTEAQMLDAAYDFDAQILADFGAGDITTSGRTMLDAANYTEWLPGQVATSVILADHSVDRIYDFGSDENESLRPIIHATFWPTINKVHVRFIVENSSTEVLQDQTYDLILKTGAASPSTVYTKDALAHYNATRWTKDYWIGGDPGNLDFDYNLEYLVSTKTVFNYDPEKVISEETIAAAYSSWGTKNTDLYEAGNWTIAMATTGGRPDIGPYPQWVVAWLYTGDHREREIALKNADLAAAWGMHYREGDSAKYLDRADAVAGIGKILSISNRPTIALIQGYDYLYTAAADRITTAGTCSTTRGGWSTDTAHMPEANSIPYLLTGDYWYLEQGLFSASYQAAHPNGAATAYSYGRGPTGAEGGLAEQMRGWAWTLRTRVSLSYITPDDMPEKDLLEMWVNDAIAIEEGYLNITTTDNYNTAMWTWGRQKKASSGATPTLSYGAGAVEFAQEEYGIDVEVTEKALSLFEQNFLMIAMGRAQQCGFASDAILTKMADLYIGMTTNADYNPYLLGNGRLPTTHVSDSQYFTGFADLLTGYTSATQAVAAFDLSDTTHGYDFIGSAACAAIVGSGVSGVDTMWTWVQTEIEYATILNADPKWALLPIGYAAAVTNYKRPSLGGILPSVNGKTPALAQ